MGQTKSLEAMRETGQVVRKEEFVGDLPPGTVFLWDCERNGGQGPDTPLEVILKRPPEQQTAEIRGAR